MKIDAHHASQGVSFVAAPPLFFSFATSLGLETKTPDKMVSESMVMALVATLSSVLVLMLRDSLTSLLNKLPTVESLLQLFGPKTFKVTINNNYSVIQRSGRIYDGDDSNADIITAILNHMREKAVFSRDSVFTSGAVSPNSSHDVHAYDLRYFPQAPVECDGCLVERKHSTSVQSSSLRVEESLIITSKMSTEFIHKFIEMCVEKYRAQQRARQNLVTRVIYRQAPPTQNHSLIFSMYPNLNKTTFDMVYLPEKDRIISLVDKYRRGELQKLSFLLHGTHGCGKTSIIKALEAYTNYTIIEVKLSYMESDQELSDLFHSNEIPYWGGDYPRRAYVPQKERIYILEDVDAESDQVHQRANKSSKNEDDSETEEMEETLSELTQPVAPSPVQRIPKFKPKINRPKLTLAGMLNTFDGVMEITGILIMTTNFPDKLDEALVRPGRITQKIKLEKITKVLATQMIKDKFGETVDWVEDKVITPAELASICEAASDVTELHQMYNTLVATSSK